MHLLHTGVALLGYVVLCRFVLWSWKGARREIAFLILNIAGVYGLLFFGHGSHYLEAFLIYLALAFTQYLMLWIFLEWAKGWHWLAFFTPIIILILVRYVPVSVYEKAGNAFGWAWHDVPAMVGISYLAFRCSRLIVEVRNGSVPKPNLFEYLNFAFFLPTMPVGPINTYENFRRAFSGKPLNMPTRAALRVIVGMVKYDFLGSLCNQLSYSGLLLDDHWHHWIDLPVAMIFYYLYLYCNFSGFCDMAIGAAGLIGIYVPENFDNPFLARNMREFWNRWHITLSQYMRDMVFSPLSKYLVRWLGPARVNHAVALTVAIVFLLVGIWHGAGWNYVAFGLAQSLGVVTVHYFTIFLKNRLGRDGFKAYNENRWIRALAVIITFCYFATSLIFFANSFAGLQKIFSTLR